MAGSHNLRERLRRIREAPAVSEPLPRQRPAGGLPRETAAFRDWVPSGFQTLKRGPFGGAPLVLPDGPPRALPLLIPDLGRSGEQPPAFGEYLFFDLETTGLSGGAGTVAFLAAFGRLIPPPESGAYRLHITQYLLLDYPGEPAFLEALLGEMGAAGGDRPLVVTYNGKSFDSQILKSRCLMNGMGPPEYRHADLLHPARRLWKRALPSCSQGAIETGVLGRSRDGDIPGALAPDIWFSFLKTGDGEALAGICDHNRRDIEGLAGIFAAMVQIAADPLGRADAYRCDIEGLALYWRGALRRDGEKDPSLHETGTALVRFAAARDCPRAVLAYARDLLHGGDYGEGRAALHRLAAGTDPAAGAAALRLLAMDSEWRLGNPAEALELVNRGLELTPPDSARRKELERRAERLSRKLGAAGEGAAE